MPANRNMKTKTLGVLSFALMSLLLTVTLSASPEWTEFSSPEGRFSILMPGKPKAGIAVQHVANLTVTAHTFTAVSPSIDLMCGYYEVPSPQQDVDKIFNGTRDESIKGVHGTLLTEEKLALDGYPGRRFRSTSNTNIFVDEEMFLVKRRFYLITITTPNKDRDKDIDKIFASFHFRPADQ